MGEHLIYICEICQTVLDEHQCKAVCPNCGRMFDCSDLPLIQANGLVEDERELISRPGANLADMLPRSEEKQEPPPRSPEEPDENLP
jgi:hypothetical protein